MAKVISQEKANKVSRLIASDLKEKSVKAEELLNEEISKVLIANTPLDIIKFWKKYPDFIYKAQSFYFRIDGNDKAYVSPIAPFCGLGGEACNELINSLENKIYYHGLYYSMRDAENKFNKMRINIECALTNLRTYKRIKENFPEAYAVLVEKVDGEDIPVCNSDNSNLCDSVENIRAALSAKK